MNCSRASGGRQQAAAMTAAATATAPAKRAAKFALCGSEAASLTSERGAGAVRLLGPVGGAECVPCMNYDTRLELSWGWHESEARCT